MREASIRSSTLARDWPVNSFSRPISSFGPYGLFETSNLMVSARLARLGQAVHGGIDTVGRHFHAGACRDGLHRLTEALWALQKLPATVAQRPLGWRARAADVERRHDPLERP